MQVRTHLHLPRMKANNHACISVKPKIGLTYYVPEIILKDVTFKVSPAGRRRTLETRQRNVHAWVIGEPTTEMGVGYWQEGYYNPYKTETFINRDSGKPVVEAKYAYMLGSKVFFIA